MSPSKFQDSDVTKGVINGPRPLPLRINKDSHVIHKPPPPNTSAAETSAAVAKQSAAKRQPVIIYTHSPKVIHTQAHDFMALVQKLTGMTRADDVINMPVKSEAEAVKEEDSSSDDKDSGVNNVGYDEISNETTSVLADDQRFMCGDVKQDSAAVSPMYKMSNAFLVDAPLFTPNSNEFFCSPRQNSMFQSPNMAAASSISPSFMDYMKAFPDY